jgi:hypothetical protein
MQLNRKNVFIDAKIVKPSEPEGKKGRAKALHGRLIATNNYFKKSYGEGVAVGL